MIASAQRRRAPNRGEPERRERPGETTARWSGVRRKPTSSETRVLVYLREDWEKRYRVTNIEQAMAALGYPFSHEARMRVAACLRKLYLEDPAYSKRLAKWGPEIFAVTNDEKLVARSLLLDYGGSRRFRAQSEIARALAMEEAKVNRCLEALRDLGFIDTMSSRGGLQYHLAADHTRFVRGLGMTFHVVRLPDGAAFNVQCAADALLLATSVYADREVTIEDSCHHCVSRLSVRLRGQRILSQSPRGIWMYDSSRCEDTNLFRSEKHLQQWIGDLPARTRRGAGGRGRGKSISVKEFVERRAER